ncbi:MULTISPECIES: hypothetical protein [Streptomyces]|uniref:FlgD Ig-like domain-containing protein n=2 Tax=Streptomyces TaxID=1883 RepID=A0ABU4JZQ2_9ACTN|nr:hypothetical protein [Streptomyces roseolus]MDX2290979.1 hypothetical protein [Streptomyces roseolus]
MRGGIVGQGEGLYRVTGGGAKPQVAKVATTGAPTEIVATAITVPGAVLDLDQNHYFGFRFALSRRTGDVTLAVRHVRTGRTTTVEAFSSGTDVRLPWERYDEAGAHPNGDYTWRLTATPDNGIGPAAVLTGAFKVVRKSQPHDFNDNGTPSVAHGPVLPADRRLPPAQRWCAEDASRIGLERLRPDRGRREPGRFGGR